MNKLKLFILLLTMLALNSLKAQETTNTQSLTGEQREQLIQKAAMLRKDENYGAAINQLDTILLHNPADAPILLFKGDLLLQSKRFDDAAGTYQKLLPLNYEHTIAQINLSYALFMNHQPAKALQFAQSAWEQDKANSNAIVNYFNAMLWNIKTKDADVFLQQQQSLLTPAQVLVLKARLFTTSGNYNKGLQYYDSLVTNYSNKYYVQEYAEVLLGKKDAKEAAAAMKKGGQLFSANEYNAFIQKMKAQKQQQAGTDFVYFKDGAKNTRIENIAWWQQSDGRKFSFGARAGISTITSAQQEKTKAQFAQVSINEHWNRAWSGQTELLLQHIQPNNSNSFAGLTGRQTIQYQPNDRRMVGMYYSADILNFTASLLEKNIRSNNVGYVTNIMLSGKTGFYSQGSWGALNDENRRLQFFGSLYHLFRTEPTLKAGINFSALHFKDSTIKTYFAPNQYLSSEVFADYSTALPLLSKFYFQMQVAAGVQRIEKQSWDPAFRLQTEIGFRLPHFESSLKYQRSNIAAATGTGYRFNWFTFRLAFKW